MSAVLPGVTLVSRHFQLIPGGETGHTYLGKAGGKSTVYATVIWISLGQTAAQGRQAVGRAPGWRLSGCEVRASQQAREGSMRTAEASRCESQTLVGQPNPI